MFMYDLHLSRHNYEDFTLFSLDDIDNAFSKVTQLKYSQSVAFKGRGLGITVIPLPAGHMIGGTIWKIIKDGEEEIVYAMDFNHKRERHLNGCNEENFRMPSLLIIDAYNASYEQQKRKQRDEELMSIILSTLRKNSGNVLIAVDTAGRVLELAHMLDQLWRTPESGLMAYNVALLSFMSISVIEFAKSQVEWMSDKITKSFEGQRNNPYHFKHLQLCNSKATLAKVREPRVVLATQPDLECGLARELFVEYCKNPKNSVILTQRSSPDTLASNLRKLISETKLRATPQLTLEIKKRLPLEGLALEEYRAQQKIKQELLKKDAKDESDSEEEPVSEDEEMDTSVGDDKTKPERKHSTEARHDLMMPKSGEGKAKSFFKQVKKTYPMYPCIETKIKWDDYGEIINPQDFMIFDQHQASSRRGPQDEENKENKLKDAEMVEVVEEIPTQCITDVQTVAVAANLSCIDFEGRSDGESLKKIVTKVKPRRLIIVHGSPEASEDLYAYCKMHKIVSDKIFMPRLYEVVDATTESHIYQVRLKDSLVSSLNFSQAKDGVELAWVEGELEMAEKESILPQEETKHLDLMSLDSQKAGRELLPTLRPLPQTEHPTHGTAFINELKLSDFKQVLVNSGVQCEFAGGVLYCNNQVVAVRRNEAGRIHLEGTVCEDYFKVRELLYQQYAVV